MKLFNFGKNNDSNKGLKGAEILFEMKEAIMRFVKLGERDQSEVEEYSTVFITNCHKGKMNPTFSVVGNAKSLVEMLYSGALKDEEFGKILVTAMEAAVMKSEELADLQKDLKSTGKIAMGALRSKGSKKSLNMDDLENMSEDEIKALAKKLSQERNDD